MRMGAKKQKQKPGSATQEPEDLSSHSQGVLDNQSHVMRECDLGTAWGIGLKASHCSELGFI